MIDEEWIFLEIVISSRILYACWFGNEGMINIISRVEVSKHSIHCVLVNCRCTTE